MNFWPPYLGAGIRVRSIAKDFKSIQVEMKLRFWNRNYVGTHFGGSLYSMTDPFFMFMLIENLGPEYVVWDKAATVRFKRPGRGRVRASFLVTQEQIDSIRDQANREKKVEPVFHAQVIDDEGTVVAEVEKLLYVRRKS
jgi:hypothetical protein